MMKKLALLIVLISILTGCADEVQFNTPGFQGNKNYNLWRATYYSGKVIDNRLIITAGNNSEQMSFTLSSASANTYVLTSSSFSMADFTDFEEIEYSTSNPPDPSVSLYPEIGEVIISESTPNYVSGTFHFIAYTADGLHSVGFNEGDFYRVPLNGVSSSGSSLTCQDATTNLATALTNFSEVMPGDAQYAARCNAYKTALQEAIAACGDQGGVFQAIIDGLGNCN